MTPPANSRTARTRIRAATSAMAWLLGIVLPLHAADPALPSGPPPGTWAGAHDGRLSVRDGRLHMEVTGPDPYFVGPPVDFPPGQDLWLVLEATSAAGGPAQVFHFTGAAAEEDSVRFALPAGGPHRVRIPLPALGPGVRLRIDPPGDRGEFVLHRLAFEARPRIAEPSWPSPRPLPDRATGTAVTRGRLRWELVDAGWGRWRVVVDGTAFARGHDRLPVGYQVPDGTRWFRLDTPTGWEVASLPRPGGPGIRVTARFRDPDGAAWTLVRTVEPSGHADAIETTTDITVDREREVVFLPLELWLPGADAFGARKARGLFAGVEDLADEESSSTRAHRGPGALRRVPDPRKPTFPLMALAAGGRFLSMAWEPAPDVAALHDSPDRLFGSGGHVWGLLTPGADPGIRSDGSLLPYTGRTLLPGVPVTVRSRLTGGSGDDLIPALQSWWSQAGPPALPEPGVDRETYLRRTARAWLDSPVRDGARYRHAIGPGFGAQPASDAAVHQAWLAGRVGDPGLAERLRAAADEAAASVPPGTADDAQIGHLRAGHPALVLGGVRESLGRALQRGRATVGRFRDDGTVRIAVDPRNAGLLATHDADHANGFTGSVLVQLLRDAAYTADPDLLADGLRILRQHLGRSGEVPRGAQPWEIPLHAPDLLASAHWVEAYALGHEATRDPAFLAEAVRWAWNGLPFVYLQPALPGRVGPYATIAVLGATHFVAPDWVGLPVQWCGLVHADALHELARQGAPGPWPTLADGIVRSAIQQLHGDTPPELDGLLPDSFDLRAQHPNPVPINPATLFPLALRSYGDAPLDDRRRIAPDGPWVHAPGPVAIRSTGPRSATLRITPWSTAAVSAVLSGVRDPSDVTRSGAAPPSGDREWVPESRWLILRITGATELEVRW